MFRVELLVFTADGNREQSEALSLPLSPAPHHFGDKKGTRDLLLEVQERGGGIRVQDAA